MTHPHSLDTIAGYQVRQTIRGGERIADEVVATFAGGGRYGEALDAARALREVGGEGIASYAVVDPVYSCGCIGQG